jgi:hypothetical protein
MLPHSTSVLVLPSQGFHSMGLTMKSVVVLSGFTEVSLDEDELPHAATASRPTSAITEKCCRLSIHSY